MFKLIKHLKKYYVFILCIVGFLVLQATCDLSLPEFTSKIIDVGIQQGGIENLAIEEIRESQFNKLKLFLKDDDIKLVEENYKVIDNGETSKSKKYVLNTKDKEKKEKISNVMAKPMVITQILESDSEEGKNIKNNIFKSLPKELISSNDGDIFKVLLSMPKSSLSQMTNKMEKNLEKIPDKIIQQSAVKFVVAEYTALGKNVDKIKSNYIILAGLKMLGIALVSLIATVIVGLLAARVAASLGRDLRKKVFSKVMGFSNAEMDKFSTATLITRSTNDIQQIQMLMAILLRVVFYAPILGVGGVIKVFNTNTSMEWIIGVAVLSISILVIFMFSFVMPKFKKVQKLVDKVNLVMREHLTGMMVIRAFSTEKHEEKRFDKANRELTKTNLFVTRFMSAMMPMMMLIMNGISILIVWKGAHGIDSGVMQVGDMMAFIQYTMQIIMSFVMISMVSIMLPRATVAAVRVDEILTTENSIISSSNPEDFMVEKKGQVEFKNVSFKYPDGDENVLSDISFLAKPGETTAFIGSTGSGKSTLINLIPRFYDVTEGEILVDGVNIKKVDEKKLRDKIGYVPQKGVLFSGTIASNLRYGNVNASDDEIEKAAAIAQASDFIEEKVEKYDYPMAQGGTNVSGGQKQRLSIGRAIAKNPDIYIFDDSFSALDYKTDKRLRQALKREINESTVLIVAQRISTIIDAEQIVVLDEGKVVGIGNHKQLLSNCEVYKQIAMSQLSKEELENE
ncbi:ATP-binding cassette, subfamily B [Hathewaya proteolytica DSM 3090]|uniref:ATP-binding cassette, subfamily B n=1 Tax=Hathewaya proteolytica DSM 3090 TaxID=1121331 RepID=A0A1M6QD41_9CLOT|nr:ABC transporter ATP-binding protein [Hathewaya proteolytica]SHK18224.1 ATP-binding cassette, subfamily B [Hathewaya proteolytica DSM 3090]